MPTKGGKKETGTQSCPNCATPRDDWRDPAGYDGTYCCQGCAEGGACTCGVEIAEQKSKPKDPNQTSFRQRDNRAVQQRDQGTNRGSADADRQRASQTRGR